MLSFLISISFPVLTPAKTRAVALLNAVKKQFGLNTHLLQLPSLHDQTTFEVPIPLPQLPSISSHTNQKPPSAHTLSLVMSELDAQNTSRFVREFATMALIPWMERCVADWNEAVSGHQAGVQS